LFLDDASHTQSVSITRYYFDLQDDFGITSDDEGMEFASLQRVQEEAARSLADMARDEVITFDGTTPHELAIAVRDDHGPVLQVRFLFEVAPRSSH
jgi:hypothetical protein